LSEPSIAKREIRTNYGSIRLVYIFCDAQGLLRLISEQMSSSIYENARRKMRENDEWEIHDLDFRVTWFLDR
jgi:hypothetical protein